MNLIQLMLDNEEYALFSYPKSMPLAEAEEKLQEAYDDSEGQDEVSPLDYMEEVLEGQGIERQYVDVQHLN